jgi:murein DD-endopeptidase MepM/ murein hydrolase activator NlpD
MCTALLAVQTGASAQILQPTTTTTTSPPQTASTTTTTAPKLVGGGGDDPGQTNGVIPPGYAKIIASVKRSKANNTHALLNALQPLVDHGMTPAQAAIAGFGRFPVAGNANFTDDWLNPRFTPIFHLHEGTDIFAPMGTPVRSPVDGVLRHASGGAGGTAAYVRTVEGHDVYFAHLSAYSDMQPGASVKTGDVIGFVGDTGNAKGGAAHLHFEIHPRGKGPVNPKPYLDQWIAQALQNAPQLVANYHGALAQTTPSSVPTVLPAAVQRIEPPRAQLAWASSANPTGGALRIAEVEATVASLKVDWNERARIAEADRKARAAADAQARAALRPLTPRALYGVLGL